MNEKEEKCGDFPQSLREYYPCQLNKGHEGKHEATKNGIVLFTWRSNDGIYD